MSRPRPSVPSQKARARLDIEITGRFEPAGNVLGLRVVRLDPRREIAAMTNTATRSRPTYAAASRWRSISMPCRWPRLCVVNHLMRLAAFAEAALAESPELRESARQARQLCQPNPWVEPGVHHVDHQVDDDDQGGGEQHERPGSRAYLALRWPRRPGGSCRDRQTSPRHHGVAEHEVTWMPRNAITGIAAFFNPWRHTTKRSVSPLARAVRM